MKKILIVFFLCLEATFSLFACPDRIKSFYINYMTDLLEDKYSCVGQLCEEYMSEELLAKIKRVSMATGVDAVIRAQDVSKDAIETLQVEILGNNWFMVRYLWDKNKPDTVIEISLKTMELNGKCIITYITPIWNGNRYGDELLLLSDAQIHHNHIDSIAEKCFIWTFYQEYTSVYSAMPKDLENMLATLRSKYLTANALMQFDSARTEHKLDGKDGYDLLIGNYDFEYTWTKMINVRALQDDVYELSYMIGKRRICINIKLKKENGEIWIDDIHVF